MAIVTGLSEARGVVAVSVDGRTLVRVKASFFKEFPLAEGDAIDEAQYVDRLSQAQFSVAYEAALTMLDYSARTYAQVRKSLLQKGYVPPVADAVVEKLVAARLLDDRALAERMVEAKGGKPVGRYALKRSLLQKGVSMEDAEEALALRGEEEERSAARQAAEKLARRYREDPPRAARAKLSQALARRGFSWDAIGPAIEGLMEDDSEW